MVEFCVLRVKLRIVGGDKEEEVGHGFLHHVGTGERLQRAALYRRSSCGSRRAGLRRMLGRSRRKRRRGEADGEGCRGGGGRGGRWDAWLFKTSLEVGGAHVATSQRAVDVLLKQPPVRLQDLRRLLVQRVLRVRLLGGRGTLNVT